MDNRNSASADGPAMMPDRYSTVVVMASASFAMRSAVSRFFVISYTFTTSASKRAVQWPPSVAWGHQLKSVASLIYVILFACSHADLCIKKKDTPTRRDTHSGLFNRRLVNSVSVLGLVKWREESRHFCFYAIYRWMSERYRRKRSRCCPRVVASPA